MVNVIMDRHKGPVRHGLAGQVIRARGGQAWTGMSYRIGAERTG